MPSPDPGPQTGFSGADPPGTPSPEPETTPRALGARALHPMSLLTLWLMLTLALIGAMGWNVWQVFGSFMQTSAEVMRFEELSREVTRLDEALTMAARMAAATGDAEWEARYRALGPELATALQAARELAPAAYAHDGTAQTDAANVRLLQMENRVFELVSQRDRQGAQAILLGPEYQTQKALYAQGIEASMAAVHGHLQAEFERYWSRMRVAGALGVAGLVIITGGWVGIVMLVRRHETERQQAEAARRSTEEQTKIMVETTFDAVVGMDAEGCITLWNKQAEQMFNWGRDEVLGASLPETILPISSRFPFDEMLQRYQGGEEGPFLKKRFETTASRRDGHEFPIEVTVEAVPAGSTQAFCAFIRDIAQQKRSQRQLALQYAVTHVLVEAGTTEEATARVLQTLCESEDWELGAFWSVDQQAGVLRCRSIWHTPSPGLQEFAIASWGHTFEPGVGLPGRVWEGNEPAWVQDVAGDAQHPRASLASAAGLHAALGLPVRGGESIFGVFEFFSRKVREPDQDLLQMVADVGIKVGQFVQRKRAEAALRETEEQLRQSQKMEAIGRLAGGVAHDFNNLLTVISGYTDLLLSQVAPEDRMRAGIEEIRKAGSRAASLTSQLLAFSRRQVIAPQTVDLNGIVANMEGMLRRLLGEDLIELGTVKASDLGSIKADPSQLDQVIINLAVNARDAMPNGGKLTLETANVRLSAYAARRIGSLDPGDYVTLSITDTGCGMTGEVLAQAFEPFFTTKAKGKGTGLGLSTVYGIVKQNGAHITVESEVGKGTSFKIYFPRAGERAPEAVREATAQDNGETGETILIVEDEPAVRGLVRDMLRARGYSILEARDGINAQVVSKTHLGRIDLMLTDVVMPQKSGPEAAIELLTDRPGMKVLYMSGYPDHPLFSKGPIDKGKLLLPKPFTPEALARKVREVLDMPVEEFRSSHLVG